jgi:hypothetical protein
VQSDFFTEGGRVKLRLKFPAEIEASEVFIEGRRFLLVDADSFGGLYGEAISNEFDPPSSPRKTKAQIKRRNGVSRKSASAKTEPLSTGRNDTPLEAEIIKFLNRKPMSSAELIEKTGRTPASLYSVLSLMRKAGAIESRECEEGRVNVLLTKATVSTASSNP